MRILICDDDVKIIDQLESYIRKYFITNKFPMPEIVSCTCGDDVLEKEESVDFAFLDVEMPGRNGIFTGKYLMEKNPKTKVFMVTSYIDYLDDAMRFNVFRYLTKPIDKGRLFRNLDDALYVYNIENVTVAVETNDDIKIINTDEIICVEQEYRGAKLYTAQGIIHSTKGIDYWQEELDVPCFYLSYRSFLVNMQYVSSFSKETILLKSKDVQVEAYLARRKYTDFKKKYFLYMERAR